MSNKIINLNQHNELEQQLKKDAEKLNDEIKPQLREQLFCHLANQQIEHHPVNQSRSLFKNKIAIAASLIFSVFIIQNFVSRQNIETTEVVSAPNNQKLNLNEIAIDFTAELNSKDLLASQNLNQEYKAILADMEKVKQRIIKL